MDTKPKDPHTYMDSYDLSLKRDLVASQIEKTLEELDKLHEEQDLIEQEITSRKIVPELEVVLRAVKDALKKFNLPFDVQVVDLYKNIVIVMKKP